MDRIIVTPGQIPLDTDLLNTNKNTMLALGRAFQAIFGTSTIANGLAVTPAATGLTVNVAPGSIYALENVDNTPYGTLPADTTDTIVKQGILASIASLSCPAPTTAGQSINYLIEATYSDVDGVPVLLPFYNASNPAEPWQGPDNNQAQTNTLRQGQCQPIAKPGTAATTGSQVTPPLDAGYIALAVVTVAYGQTSISAGNVVASTQATLSTSILQGLQSNAFCSGTDVGAVNACVVNLSPAPSALVNNMIVEFQVAVTNTTNATLNLNGTGALPIIGAAHLALQGGELVAGGKAEVIFSASLDSWILIGCTGGAQQVGTATQSHQALQLGQATGRLLNVQTFTASGTYTPSSPLVTSVIVEVLGGGGAGGGALATSTGQFSIGGGGAGGAYCKSRYTSGFSGQTVTIGAGGTAVAGATGGAGGASSFGALMTASGGVGGIPGTVTASGNSVFVQPNGGRTAATGGNLINTSQPVPIFGWGNNPSGFVAGNGGSNTAFGTGGGGQVGATGVGGAGQGNGAGGGGAGANASAASQTGGAGTGGIVFVWEYA